MRQTQCARAMWQRAFSCFISGLCVLVTAQAIYLVGRHMHMAELGGVVAVFFLLHTGMIGGVFYAFGQQTRQFFGVYSRVCGALGLYPVWYISFYHWESIPAVWMREAPPVEDVMSGTMFIVSYVVFGGVFVLRAHHAGTPERNG